MEAMEAERTPSSLFEDSNGSGSSSPVSLEHNLYLTQIS